MNEHLDYWSDYWANDGKGGEVFVDAHGEKPEYIRQHWQEQLNNLAKGDRVLDVACGAGSIFEDISEERRNDYSLYAADISQEALNILHERVPEAKTIQCSSSELPFPDEHFNFVVSQFGIEYAGPDAFTEAARVVARSGKISLLSHIKDGYIDSRNEQILASAKVALDSNFIESAIDLCDSAYSGSKTKHRKGRDAFVIAEKPLARCLEQYPEGIHSHLYFGFKQLYLKRKSYRKSDIVNWLQAMKRDIKKNIIKVSKIREVSLDDQQITEVAKGISEHGFNDISVDKFLVPSTENVTAWKITGTRT